MKYPEIQHAIRNFFEYNSGENGEIHFPDTLVASQEFRAALIAELNKAVSDNECEWLPLLEKEGIAFNEEVETEAEARDWLRTRILKQYLSQYL